MTLRLTHISPLLVLALSACEPKVPTTTPDENPAPEAATDAPGDAPAVAAKVDTALGGQLFDKWFKVGSYNGGFLPDSAKTEEVDGEAGPNGDGTLNDATGKAFANTGHDYRLKNFFGWDLRGAEGIYGPEYQNKSYVLSTNLLTDGRSREELAQWFTAGDAQLPAFGEVLSPAQIDALAAFVIAVREGELPQPDQIFTLSKDAPNNYTLNPGADLEQGAEEYSHHCAGCHGDKGDGIMIDGKYTVGAYGRMKAYEGWFKVVNGHPGSPMSRQTTHPKHVLDLFAALCDRSAFPGKDAENDVADGDARCGEYLE